MPLPELQAQEIPFDHPDSVNRFRPGPDKPFVATPAAIDRYRLETIVACLDLLRAKADECGGLDYLQVFADATQSEPLWFMEDGECITALLPSDY